MLALLVGCLAVVPAATASPATSSFFYTRWNFGGPAFWGNLTFNGEEARIAWGEEPVSQDGPVDATDAQLYNADSTARYYTGTSPVPVVARDYVFTSEPLPMDMYLNATQNIQIELMLSDPTKANPCPYQYSSTVNDPNMEVRLKVGDQIVGGQLADDYHFNYINWWWFGGSYSGPAPPTGWTICRFAFPPEVHILPAGTVLTLEVTMVDQDRPYQIGASGDHRSTIRFPLLRPEDALFRFPELAPEEETEGEEEFTAEGGSRAAWDARAPLAGAAVLGLALPRFGRRSSPALLAGLLVAVALSGCITSKGGANDGGAQSEALEGELENTLVKGDGSLTTGTFGSIVGRVRDDLHLPVGGVHVSILGMANFTQTDGQGQFKFLNLVPGIYKLRFDKKEYKSFEAELEVKSGFVSRPQITMVLANTKDRDARQHTHDYWPPGVTTKKVMELDLPHTCSTGGVARCDFQPVVRIPSKGDEPNTVLPGTTNVQVILDWNPAELGWDRLGIALRHNGDTYAWNQSVYAPRGPREPFNIATTWEMSDPGHQVVSTWEFTVYKGEAYAQRGYLEGFAFYADTQPAKVSMKVILTKGALPLEPGHPDRWGSANKLDVLKGGYSYWSNCLTPRAAEPTVRCYGAWTARFNPAKVIPQGTGEIEVKVDWNRAPTFPLKLLVKPANVAAPRDYYSIEGFREVGTQEGAKSMTWKFKPKPEELDPEYSKASQFQFVVQAANEDLAYVDYLVSLSNLGQVQPYLQPTPSIVAYRA